MRGILRELIYPATIKTFPGLVGQLEKISKRMLLQEIIVNANKNIPELKDRATLYQWVQDNFISNERMDYLEFGVWKGTSIKNWMQLNTRKESRFFGFDTFTGLPEDWGKHEAGTFDVDGSIPRIDDNRVTFVKGLFQDTLPQFLASYTPIQPLVVHIDSDLYSSALYCLTKLDHHLSSGSILIFDEFLDPLHEFSAFYDYTRSYYRRWEVLARCSGYYC